MRKRKIGIIIRDKVRFSVYNKLTLAKKKKRKRRDKYELKMWSGWFFLLEFP